MNTPRDVIERRVLVLILTLYREREWAKTQPWHGRPVQTDDRIAHNKRVRYLEWVLDDLVAELAEST